ncbi:hypothetical protein RND71_000109 [Anisodus tanguticus]|uniref:Uncharacterized protein n=1 Tax=Anisodus tanguticus TaxID=243964 RepID=A0AAE1VR16_9SOLA|nr:hypothetical protein RND71_000109 [Anisodus tanguticus]
MDDKLRSNSLWYVNQFSLSNVFRYKIFEMFALDLDYEDEENSKKQISYVVLNLKSLDPDRGKSGPAMFNPDLYSGELFHFDVHEDVRTIADATIEKDEA